MVLENLVNLTALTDVFLEKKKEDLKNVTKMFVVIEKKNDTLCEIEINKNELLDTLTDIFSKSVLGLKNVNIYYLKDNKKEYLNGISIF